MKLASLFGFVILFSVGCNAYSSSVQTIEGTKLPEPPKLSRPPSLLPCAEIVPEVRFGV